MENLQKETDKGIKSDKYLTRLLISVALIIIGAIFIIIALNQPRVSADKAVSSSVQTSVYNKTDSDSTADNFADLSESTNTSTEKSASAVDFPINLNTCTAEDLMSIEHVGETRANAIIAYREYLGGYTSVDQLKNISGIGDSVYESIEPYVTV